METGSRGSKRRGALGLESGPGSCRWGLGGGRRVGNMAGSKGCLVVGEKGYQLQWNDASQGKKIRPHDGGRNASN